MKLPQKVNCIVLNFRADETRQIPSFIFCSASAADYSPEQALLTLAEDWYHHYLLQLQYRQRYITGLNKTIEDFREQKLSLNTFSKKCCLDSLNVRADYCHKCLEDFRVNPSHQDFLDFLTLRNDDPELWQDSIPLDTQDLVYHPRWTPFALATSLLYVMQGEFLMIAESAEYLMISVLTQDKKYSDALGRVELAPLMYLVSSHTQPNSKGADIK